MRKSIDAIFMLVISGMLRLLSRRMIVVEPFHLGIGSAGAGTLKVVKGRRFPFVVADSGLVPLPRQRSVKISTGVGEAPVATVEFILDENSFSDTEYNHYCN